MDMITAQTEIDNLNEKTENVKKKIGTIIADFALSRAKTDKSQRIDTEIDTLIKDLSTDDKVDVLSQAIVAIIKNINNTNIAKSSKNSDSRKNNNKYHRNDIFTNRDL